MDITFTLMVDGKHAGVPRIRRHPTGWEATHTLLADSSDERKVALAPGFPQTGQLFGPGFGQLQVFSAEARYWKGKDSNDGAVRGYCQVDVVYQTPGLNGSLPPPKPGLKFSRILPGTLSQTAYSEITADGGPVDPAASINNGYGVDRVFGVTRGEVYVYRDAAAFDPDSVLPTLIDLQTNQRLNAAGVVMPPLLGAPLSQGIQIDAGQARYESYRLDVRDGVVEIVHELALAADHVARWRSENDKGEAVGPIKEARIYPDGSFAGLW